MPRMHELIAVYDDLKSQATKVRTDLIATFSKKIHHFGKKVVTTTFLQEGVPPVTDTQSDLQAFLGSELEWVSGPISKAIDAGYQIDLGNLSAKADLVIDEGDQEPVIVAKDVPATFLLQLEKHLANLRDLAVSIPTLDPARGFTLDEAAGKGIFVAREVHKEKTRKEKKLLTLAPATEKHPAQVQVYDADTVIGTILEQEWSSLTTPAVKADVLARIDVLLRAVKKARSRANAIELDVTGQKIGKKILEYAFKPVVG